MGGKGWMTEGRSFSVVGGGGGLVGWAGPGRGLGSTKPAFGTGGLGWGGGWGWVGDS